MANRSATLGAAIIIVLMIGAATWAYAQLPANAVIPVHFDAQGVANGWGSPRMLFLLPGIAALNWLLISVLPYVDPRGRSGARSARGLDIVKLAITVFLAAIQGVMVSAALGVGHHLGMLFPLCIAGLLIVIGNVMGKIRWNSFVGIRTPWALADERVWDKTQRFGGRLMVVSGIVIVVASLIPPLQPHIGFVIIACILAATLASFLQSYFYWRSDPPQLRK